MTAIEALRRLMRTVLQRRWKEQTGTPLPPISLTRQFALVNWTAEMDETERRLLSDVLAAWNTLGPEYKRHLPANADWLAAAEAKGMNLDAWLQPEPKLVQIEGQAVRIGLARNPVEVFLMGSYFGTCLSLGDINEMSVLANAYDANKQVVMMHGANGQVLGRKLLTVSDKFTLLGYHCYLSRSADEPECRSPYATAMSDFCARYARRCRLPLANDGQPAEIANHFWYDDCPDDWDASATNAWREQGRPMQRNGIIRQRQEGETPDHGAGAVHVSTGRSGELVGIGLFCAKG